MTGRDAGGQALHILLVEDNVDQRELTLEALAERLPAAQVTACGDGPAALAALAQIGPDVVILDYSLPGMSGLEVLQHINGEERRTPVIMVTGQGDETIAVEAMKSGAQDYIIKIRNYHEALPIAVERIVRQARMKRDLEEASLRARRLYEISLTAAKERRVDVIAECLVDGAARLAGTEMSVLYLLDGRGRIAVAKSYGLRIDAAALPQTAQDLGLLAAPLSAGEPVVIESPETHPLWPASGWLHGCVRQVLAVPLAMQGRVEGALCVFNKHTREPFSPEDVDTLSTLAVHAGVAVDNARFVERMEQQAVSDGLTGLYNHMEFQRCLAKELDRGRRYSGAFSLVLLDLDHFKLVNDTYGHQVGDALLKELARTLQVQLRAADKVFRYGGEEFAVILPETDKEGATAISERIRQSIAAETYAVGASQHIEVTASIGVASYPQDALQREDLIGCADQALYAAKRGGRNKVAVYDDTVCAVGDSDALKLEDYVGQQHLTLLREVSAALNARPGAREGAAGGAAVCLADALCLDAASRTQLECAAVLEHLGRDAARRDGAPERPLIEALLAQAQQLTAALQIVLYHEERYDGRGPRGLAAEAIPYLSRVLSVATAWNALTAAAATQPREAALAQLRREAGSRLDPAIVEALAAALRGETRRATDTA